jgi:hypothetical protein
VTLRASGDGLDRGEELDLNPSVTDRVGDFDELE